MPRLPVQAVFQVGVSFAALLVLQGCTGAGKGAARVGASPPPSRQAALLTGTHDLDTLFEKGAYVLGNLDLRAQPGERAEALRERVRAEASSRGATHVISLSRSKRAPTYLLLRVDARAWAALPDRLRPHPREVTRVATSGRPPAATLEGSSTSLSASAALPEAPQTRPVASGSSAPQITPDRESAFVSRVSAAAQRLQDSGYQIEVSKDVFLTQATSERFEVPVVPGYCYILQVFGAPGGVQDIDAALFGEGVAPLHGDTRSARDAITGTCVTDAQKLTLVVRAQRGSGNALIVLYQKQAQRWPAWSVHITARPRKIEKRNLSPEAVYARVADSVWVILTDKSAQGSAVAVSRKHLMTNCHVLQWATQIIAKNRQRMAEARLVSSDPVSDRCLLEVKGIELKAVTGVRSFASLRPGERVFAIGAPRGHELTLSEGLVSAVRESSKHGYVQTSAAISPGSSGGGLFDKSGNLVGITTYIQREAQNLNFALAADEWWID